jgi:predicted HicB family RNase H-like nuclease
MLELPHDIVEQSKKPRGRPRIYQDKRGQMTIRVKDTTLEKLKAAAAFMDMSVPEFVAHILETRAAK